MHTGQNGTDLTTKQLIESHELKVEEDWPPYSPDLNPVENVWAMIDREKNIILDKLDIKNYPKNKKEGFLLVQKAFENVKNEDVINCYRSFRDRLKIERRK